MSVCGGPKISTNGMQLYFMPKHIGSYTGGNFIYNLINKSEFGQLTNSPTFSGIGLIFNSGALTGQGLQVYHSPTTGMFSVEMVVKRIPGSTSNQQLVNTSLYYTGGTSYEVNYNNSTLSFNVNRYDQNANVLSHTFLQNQYTHYYMLFNTGIQKLYANGLLVSSGGFFNTGTRDIAKPYSFANLSYPVGPPPIPAATSSYGTQSEIALIRIYGKELSMSEVYNNFIATKSFFNII